MTAEEIHIKKLKEIGYKDESIKELVKQFHRQQKYLFAEDIYQEKLKLLGIANVSDTLIAWEQFKKANWYESESIDVEKMLMDKFQAIYGR